MKLLRRTLVATLGLLLGGMSAAVLAGEVMVPGAGKSATIDQIKKQGELRLGIAIAPPWLGQDPNNGQYFGPSFEIGQRVALVLGVDVKTVSSGWDVIIAGIQGNQFELAIAPLFATEKRKKVVDFVNYLSAGTCYVVLKDGPLKTLDDLNQAGVRIGTWTGTGTEHGIREKYTNATIDSIVQSVGGAHRIPDVLTKRVDAAPIDDALAFVIAAEYPATRILPGGPENCVKNSDIPFPIGMAFSYGDAEFKNFLQAVVDDMGDEISNSLVKFTDPKYMKQ
jgi:ABC-type amino acid transport substrate-binding protein